MKNSFKGLKSRFELIEERISKLKGRSIDTIQSKEITCKKKKKKKKTKEPQRPERHHQTHHICIMGVPEEKRRKGGHKYMKK